MLKSFSRVLMLVPPRKICISICIIYTTVCTFILAVLLQRASLKDEDRAGLVAECVATMDTGTGGVCFSMFLIRAYDAWLWF